MREFQFIRNILPPHHLLVALCHCELVLGQPSMMILTSRGAIVSPMACGAFRVEQTVTSSS